MTWEYGFIGFIVGVIVGSLVMKFGSKSSRKTHQLQYELNKAKAELMDHREELISHFSSSAELLNKIAGNYRQLYQHMAKSSGDLLRDMPEEQNPFTQQLNAGPGHNEHDQIVQMPRDYSVEAKEILHNKREHERL